MALRRHAAAMIDALVAGGATELSFVALLARLEQLLGCEIGGESGSLQIQLAHDPTLTFHPRDVVSIEQLPDTSDARPRVRVTTAFAGLTGAVSPLPTLLIEEFAAATDDDDDLALQRSLIEVFHHRLLVLFYRGMRALQLPALGDARGPARAWILALCGLTPETAERVTQLAEHQLLALSPLLVAHPPNAQRLITGLTYLFADEFGSASVHVREQAGGQVALSPSACARLGVDLRLGQTSVLGTRAPLPGAAIALTIAPLSPAACVRLSPGGARCAELTAAIRLLTPESIDIAVVLQSSHAPGARIGDRGSRLGQSSWLGCAGLPAPTRFEIHGLAAASSP